MMNMQFGDYSRYCGCLLRYDSYTNDFGERCCKECRKPHPPIMSFEELMNMGTNPNTKTPKITHNTEQSPQRMEQTPEIHIHIHVHGDKDPNELAKVVADSIKKNVQKGGMY